VPGATSLPPGLVSFSLSKDANGQLYYSQVLNATNGVNNDANLNTDQAAGLTMPNPTLINFAQEQAQNAQLTQDQAQQQQVQQQQAQQQQQVQQQQAQQIQQIVSAPVTLQHGLTQANFALFQQNGGILQQVNLKQPQQQQQPLSIRPSPTIQGMVLQQVGQQQQLQQVQQQIQPQQQVQIQSQQVQQLQNPQQIQVQVQQVPQQQVQQIQQQLQQQFAISGDANAFLRQLQVAQIQQQFNALQQQGGLTQSSLGTAQQQAVLQQQLQQLQRVQVPLVAMQAPQQQVPSQPIHQAPVSGALPPRAKAAPKTTATKARSSTIRKKAPVVGVGSASDTDAELSNRVVKSSGKRSPADVSGGSKKRKPPEPFDTTNMTPGERAKANRDRNREHARNTRLRKKAYLEKLKVTVDELCKERDTLVSERAGAANLLVEMHNTRTEVLMSFFALRSTNEKRRKLWASILDESCFACVMPVTPYRSFPASEVQVSKCQRTVLGIDGMMSDTASLHVLLSSLVDRSRFPHGKIEFCYTLVTEEAVVAGNQMMARWVMSTLNATQCGARMEVAKQGMLCCKFNSAHRITGLEIMFDVMALMLQLKQAAGSESFSVIPNTVQTCQRSFDKPMVMTLAEGPYTIVQVNQQWENMTGYKAEEVVGKASCSVLQGPMTNKGALQELMNEVRFKRAASVMLMNYTKDGEQFRNFIVVFPLSTDSRITHYLALTSFMERVNDNAGDGNSNMVVSQTTAGPGVGVAAEYQLSRVH
jgi:PAS domain S-box-containing protein